MIHNLVSFLRWNVSLPAFNSNNIFICVELVKAALELDYIFPQLSLLAQKAQTNSLWDSSVDSGAVGCCWHVAIATLATYLCCVFLKVSCNICAIFLMTFISIRNTIMPGDWTKQSRNKPQTLYEMLSFGSQYILQPLPTCRGRGWGIINWWQYLGNH